MKTRLDKFVIWERTKHGGYVAKAKLGKSLPILRRQLKVVNSMFKSSIESARRELDSIDSYAMDDDPDDAALYAEGMLADLNRASQIKIIAEDIEAAIEDIESDKMG